MKLGVMAALFHGMTLDDALKYSAELGLEAIEIPVGGYPGNPFFDPKKVNASKKSQTEIVAKVKDHNLSISGLAVHGNPVHPNKKRAQADHQAFVNACQLAPKLGTDIVITFAGCPGGCPTDKTPNWVTNSWPEDFQAIIKYQWDDVLIPYWSAQSKLAAKHHLKIAWEAHPGMSVYNPYTLIKLSQAASVNQRKPNLGANLDPSHLFWQGIDPVEAARVLGEAGLLFYVHAKDTEIDPHQTRINGTLDWRNYGDLTNRSWVFRTCGYGHGDEFWKPFISMLRRYDYDHVLSIEHEDPYMSTTEGLEKAIAYLTNVIIGEKPGKPWWY